MKPTIRLRDLSGTRPIPEWRPLTWGECGECGAPEPFGPADEREAVYDGEPVVCPDCGTVGSTSVDGEEDGASLDWPDYFGHEAGACALTPVALAAFRRLVGRPRAEWWEVARG